MRTTSTSSIKSRRKPMYGRSGCIVMIQILYTGSRINHHPDTAALHYIRGVTGSSSSTDIIIDRFWNRHRRKQRHNRLLGGTTTTATTTARASISNETTVSGMQNDSSTVTNARGENTTSADRADQFRRRMPQNNKQPIDVEDDDLRTDIVNRSNGVVDLKSTKNTNPNTEITTTTTMAIATAVQNWFHHHRYSSSLMQLFVRRVLQ